jgi:hypothetical protein
MEEDLKLKENEYQIAVSLLFVTYIASELPSNLVIKKFTPSRWLSFITTAWGVVATLTGDHAGVQGTGGVPDYFGRVGGRVVSGVGYVCFP